MWVKVNIGTGDVEQYPYNRKDLKAANPLKSFPIDISVGDLAALGVHNVIVDVEPSWDIAIENGVRANNVTKVDTTYHLQFIVTAKTGAEETAYFDAKVQEILVRVESKSNQRAAQGLTIASEFVPTDIASLNKLFATKTRDSISRRMKTGCGTFITLDDTELQSRRETEDEFLQDCIDNEDLLSIDINAAADLTELLAIDIEQGWPT